MFGTFHWIFDIHHLRGSYLWKSRFNTDRSVYFVHRIGNFTISWDFMHGKIFRFLRPKSTSNYFAAWLKFWSLIFCVVFLSKSDRLRFDGIWMGSCSQCIVCNFHRLCGRSSVNVCVFSRIDSSKGRIIYSHSFSLIFFKIISLNIVFLDSNGWIDHLQRVYEFGVIRLPQIISNHDGNHRTAWLYAHSRHAVHFWSDLHLFHGQRDQRNIDGCDRCKWKQSFRKQLNTSTRRHIHKWIRYYLLLYLLVQNSFIVWYLNPSESSNCWKCYWIKSTLLFLHELFSILSFIWMEAPNKSDNKVSIARQLFFFLLNFEDFVSARRRDVIFIIAHFMQS